MIHKALIATVVLLVSVLPAAAQAPGSKLGNTPDSGSDAPVRAVPVVIDGRVLFRVRGTEAFPASRRARETSKRILALAKDADTAFDLRLEDGPGETAIYSGDTLVFRVFPADSRLAGLERPVLALAFSERIKQAIHDYRAERTTEYLGASALHAVIATGALALILLVIRAAARRTARLVENRYASAIASAPAGSVATAAAEQFWPMARRAQHALWWLLIAASAYIYLEFVLDLFPWTRNASRWLLDLVLAPLRSMGKAIVDSLPDLVYLLILFVAVRYLLRGLALIFLSIGRGAIRWPGFEPEWAMPTFSLVRVIVIAFALVIAYPYIPGSRSEAFQAISVFLGILFSIGSSSMIANVLAGYALLYRSAFRIGDRVAIGEHTGDIMETRQQVTLLRTPHNEEVIIPNTEVLRQVVVNYSVMARRKELMLHAAVSIGYDTPWRQVEAMLLTAAARTEGLLKEPPPFVLKTALEDFYVRYEVKARCDDALRMPEIYSRLHENILDVFNEYGVQIMSPHFENQPPDAVLVPPEKWHAAPAIAPGEDGLPTPRHEMAGQRETHR